jgi:hypothetical protein
LRILVTRVDPREGGARDEELGEVLVRVKTKQAREGHTRWYARGGRPFRILLCACICPRRRYSPNVTMMPRKMDHLIMSPVYQRVSVVCPSIDGQGGRLLL